MKIASLTIPCLAACLSFSGCAKKQNKPVEQNAAQQVIPPPQPFVPPADSTISSAQMAAWCACNAGLDSASQEFTRTLRPADAPTDSAQMLFAKTLDRICVKNGLKGGYTEYRWITDNLGNARNKTAFDSACRPH